MFWFETSNAFVPFRFGLSYLRHELAKEKSLNNMYKENII